MPKLSNSCRQVWLTKPILLSGRKARGRNTRGQSTVEYILMIGFGALLSLQIVKFFDDVFKDGLTGLERNIQSEVQTGQGFGGNAN